MSAHCFEEEIETVAINKTTADSPDVITPNINARSPVTNIKDSDIESTKQVQKPSHKVVDLLEGRGEWSTNRKAAVLAPGIQRLIKDWLAEVIQCEDKYMLIAEISSSEALEPKTLSEAKTRPDWTLWEKACEEELNTLKEAGTWEVVDASKDTNIVGSKWVFRAKKDAAGNVIRYSGSKNCPNVCLLYKDTCITQC